MKRKDLIDFAGVPLGVAIVAGAVLGALAPWWGWVMAGCFGLAWLGIRLHRRLGA